MVHLGDDTPVGRARVDIGDVFRPRLAETGEAGALPIVALLPGEPLPVRVVAVQLVGTERDRRVEVERERILALEDVLRHHPRAFPADREQRVEAGVRALQVKDDGVRVRRLDALDIELIGAAAAEAVGLHVRLGREQDVVGREFDPITPVDAGAQLHRHLGEVVIVDGRLGGERVVPHAVEPVVGVDVPERVHRQLVEAGRLVAVAGRGPDVEPVGIGDGAVRVLEDQVLVARDLLRDSGAARPQSTHLNGDRPDHRDRRKISRCAWSCRLTCHGPPSCRAPVTHSPPLRELTQWRSRVNLADTYQMS